MSKVTLDSETLCCGPGLASVKPTTVQAMVWLPLAVLPSGSGRGHRGGLPDVAELLIVPEIMPVVESMLSPVGKPLALKVKLSPLASDAVIGTETVSPSTLYSAPGAVRVILGVEIVQLKVCEDVVTVPSVAEMVTVYGLLVSSLLPMVPEISPVLEL